MLKKITLFLFMVFNLNIFSQVVIKDEIVLDEDDSPDAETLTMPFYGKIIGYVNSNCYEYCGLKLVTIEANGQLVERGTPYNCGGGWVSSFWSITNVPAGVPVEIKVYTCVNNVFTEAQTELQSIGANQYKVRFYSGTHEDWYDATTVTFTATTPLNCEYASTCSTGYIETMPDTLSVIKPLDFTYDNECAENPNALGVFMGAQRFEEAGNISELTPEEDIEVCFDLQSQKWKFNLLVENVTLNYVKDICLDHIIDTPISATPLYSLESICQLPLSECSKLKNSIESHKTYPLGSGIYDGYAFVQVLLTHETEHQRDWEKYVRNHIYKYYNIPDKIDFKCEDFNSMQQAREEILKEIKDTYVSDFWNPYKTDYLNGEYLIKGMGEMKLKREKEVHRRKSIKGMIKIYEDEIAKFCKDECN